MKSAELIVLVGSTARAEVPAATRRAFMTAGAALLGATSLRPLAWRQDARASLPVEPIRSTSTPAAAAAVLSYLNDRPYWDASGRGALYTPPSGARSGDGLALHGDADFLGQFGYC